MRPAKRVMGRLGGIARGDGDVRRRGPAAGCRSRSETPTGPSHQPSTRFRPHRPRPSLQVGGSPDRPRDRSQDGRGRKSPNYFAPAHWWLRPLPSDSWQSRSCSRSQRRTQLRLTRRGTATIEREHSGGEPQFDVLPPRSERRRGRHREHPGTLLQHERRAGVVRVSDLPPTGAGTRIHRGDQPPPNSGVLFTDLSRLSRTARRRRMENGCIAARNREQSQPKSHWKTAEYVNAPTPPGR